jgi:hypothetical protein
MEFSDYDLLWEKAFAFEAVKRAKGRSDMGSIAHRAALPKSLRGKGALEITSDLMSDVAKS